MEFTVFLQSLDGGNFSSVGLHREDRARFHRGAVHQHRAGAAIGRIASDVRARQLKIFAKKFNEQQPRRDFTRMQLAVDAKVNGNF